MDKEEVDNVEGKLDHINEAIHKLIHELNVSKSDHSPFSFISPINSFTESFLDIHENFPEFSQQVQSDAQGLYDKFQEMLTENDRLNMKVEDLTVQVNKISDPVFEILFSRENLQSLSQDIEKFLKENTSQVLMKLKKDSFYLQSLEKHEKIVYFTGEIKSSYFEKSEEVRKEKDEKILAIQLIKKKAEFETAILNYNKKQEKLMQIEEILMEKMESLEIAKADYMSKLAKIEKRTESNTSTPVKSKRTCSCSDQTNYSYVTESASFQNNISKMLNNLEKAVKQQYFKDSIIEENESKDVTLQYNNKKRIFNESLGQFSNKESYILNYFRELSCFYDEKFKELYEYEKYLQESWVETCGSHKSVSTLHKASSKNFEMSQILKKEREKIEEKHMRISKIKLIIEEERKKLEFHRKKILFERQALFSQQNDEESALEQVIAFQCL